MLKSDRLDLLLHTEKSEQLQTPLAFLTQVLVSIFVKHVLPLLLLQLSF